MAEILTVEGHRAPPSAFVKKLERFDPNLRVVWGLGQAAPFPGWVIERRLPGHMKEKLYNKTRPATADRYASQEIVDQHGKVIGHRQFDMIPDWHPVYCVVGSDGQPISELGDFVIEYLRRPDVYRRTLLGFPELSMKLFNEDHEQIAAARAKKEDDMMTQIAEKVMDHRTEVFAEVFAFGGQPNNIKEGTELT